MKFTDKQDRHIETRAGRDIRDTEDDFYIVILYINDKFIDYREILDCTHENISEAENELFKEHGIEMW